jgi:hypothetical protein
MSTQNFFFDSQDALVCGIKRYQAHKNLVVVRAGDTSLHRNWLPQPDEKRNWDLCVSYYGENNSRDRFDCDFFISKRGSKFDPIYEMHAKGAFLDYAHIWLPDDDIDANCNAINGLFSVSAKHGLHIAQPALTEDSYFSHEITKVNPDSRLRFTNFVEVMCPLFSAHSLQICAPSFEGAKTAWGLDFAWFELLGRPENRLAIIDQYPVRHTRPIAASYNQDAAFEELRKNLEKYKATHSAVEFSRISIPVWRRILNAVRSFIWNHVHRDNHS